MTSPSLYTLGHSNRSLEDFLELLVASDVRRLVDVRSRPYSRRHPQFSREPLAEALRAQGVDYVWMGETLGGHRHARPDSPHLALEPDWRGYADHALTPEFDAALDTLERLASEQPTAVMCAERLPEHCHRRFIADAWMGRGHRVLHLIALGERRAHALDTRARRENGHWIYDRGGQQELSLD
jgi:uncharacterized protein (DUF488 family)